MIAKLVVWSKDRPSALRLLKDSLRKYNVRILIEKPLFHMLLGILLNFETFPIHSTLKVQNIMHIMMLKLILIKLKIAVIGESWGPIIIKIMRLSHVLTISHHHKQSCLHINGQALTSFSVNSSSCLLPPGVKNSSS